MNHQASLAFVHGDQRLEGSTYYCRHCGGWWPAREFFIHISVARHVELLAITLQHARVLGREPTRENLLISRLFSGNEPTPEIARVHVALARRGEWP